MILDFQICYYLVTFPSIIQKIHFKYHNWIYFSSKRLEVLLFDSLPEKFPKRSYFWSVFSCIGTRNNFVFGRFSRSVFLIFMHGSFIYLLLFSFFYFKFSLFHWAISYYHWVSIYTFLSLNYVTLEYDLWYSDCFLLF